MTRDVCVPRELVKEIRGHVRSHLCYRCDELGNKLLDLLDAPEHPIQPCGSHKHGDYLAQIHDLSAKLAAARRTITMLRREIEASASVAPAEKSLDRIIASLREHGSVMTGQLAAALEAVRDEIRSLR